MSGLSTIRALIAEATNEAGALKLQSDNHDKYVQGITGSGTVVTTMAKSANGGLEKSAAEIAKIWNSTRKHIAQGAVAQMGALAALSTTLLAISQSAPSFISKTSAAAVANGARSDPYVTLINTASKIIIAGIETTPNADPTLPDTTQYDGVVIAIGVVLMILALGVTIGALGSIALLEDKSYKRQSAAGRDSLGTLSRLINRASDSGQANKLDRNIHRSVMLNGQENTQYDADPATSNTGGTVTVDGVPTAYAAAGGAIDANDRFIQNGP